MKQVRNLKRKQKGTALLASFMVMGLLGVGLTTYVDQATQRLRDSRRQAYDVQLTGLCESGIQTLAYNLWIPFKNNQQFAPMDASYAGASASSPLGTQTGELTGIGKYSVGVISFYQPGSDSYTRQATVRAVAWIDLNGNNVMDAQEPQKIVDMTITYTLSRSKVFDYTYFVNNYGWMNGFGPTDLVVNGDMRANGDFNFLNGSPTVNGSVVACANNKLTPGAAGNVNTPPVKQTDAAYIASAASKSRWRQGYSSGTMGAKGSAQYEGWRDYAFESSASIVNGAVDGANVDDVSGMKSWDRTNVNSSATTSMIDPQSSKELTLPDLSDLTYYQNLSQTFVDSKATYGDGTSNPNYGLGAYVDVWNSLSNAYVRISTNGVVTGSAILVGTASHPIKVHGPVTFTQDCVITGNVAGQGTLYTGRNVHVVGSIIYNTPPDFRGTDQTAIDNANEKADMVALAARGSVIMGDTSQFNDSYPLQYMTPPFTHGRYDDYGNWIPPFNAKEVDSTGKMKYQSVLGDTAIHNVSSSVGQIDALLFTNFVGGGDVGVGGNGVKFNGSIISKDEAIVVFSLPMEMNYDSRIRERKLTKQPIVDIQLPRSPVMIRSNWNNRGFTYGGHG